MQLEYEVDKKGIGSRLKYHRKRMRFKQEELAQKMGVTEKYISKLESGVSQPSVPYLMKFSDFSGVSIDYLLRGKLPGNKERKASDRLYDSPEYQTGPRLSAHQRYIYDEVTKKLLSVLSETDI